MSRPWRLPALILIPVLVVVGVLAQTGGDDEPSDAVRLAEMTPTAAAPGTLSSTWYCAAGSATGVLTGNGAGPAEQVVLIANASEQPSTVRVTAFPGPAEPPAEGIAVGEAPSTTTTTAPATTTSLPESTSTDLVVGPHSRQPVRVSDVLGAPAPWASALVEVTGGEVTVAHELTGPDGRSITDCASSPSANWYFPGGTTLSGSRLWLALFNPFPGEATVDVAFDTTGGARNPGSFQGIVVPSRSVVVREVSAAGVASEQENVSTTVSVRSGRIVAEMVQSDSGREDMNLPKGLTSTIGATVAAPTWTFPATAPPLGEGDTAVETVWIFNPGDTDTTVRVQVQLNDPSVTVEPFEVSVAAHRMHAVPVRNPYEEDPVKREARIPQGMPYWLIVQSTDGAGIVAERMLTGSDREGVSYSIGLPVVASRWLVPVPTASGVSGSLVTVANPSATDTASVSLRRHEAGAASDVVATFEIAPGGLQPLDMLAAGLSGDGGSIEVLSDIPVVVGQTLSFATPDLATPLGVPVFGTQSLPLDLIGPGVVDDALLDAPPDDGVEPPVSDPEVTDPGATDPAASDPTSTTAPASTTATAPGASTTTTAAGASSSTTAAAGT